MSLQKGVSNQYAIFIMLEYYLFLQDNASHSIYSGRHFVTIKFSYILMSFRAVIVALIFMKTKVEFCSMLHNSSIKRRQQHMIVIIHFWNRDNQQSMILTSVAINNRRA